MLAGVSNVILSVCSSTGTWMDDSSTAGLLEAFVVREEWVWGPEHCILNALHMQRGHVEQNSLHCNLFLPGI